MTIKILGFVELRPIARYRVTVEHAKTATFLDYFIKATSPMLACEIAERWAAACCSDHDNLSDYFACKAERLDGEG